MKIGWPRPSASRGCTMRATMSTAPPGGKETTNLMGFAGYCCADAGPLHACSSTSVAHFQSAVIPFTSSRGERVTLRLRCTLQAEGDSRAMQLYGFPPTRSIRVLWTLRELDVEFESVNVDPTKGELRRPDFLAV